MSGTRPPPTSTEAKAAIPTLSRRPWRRLVVGRMCRPMDRGTVMVGVVPAFDQSRGGSLIRLIALRGAGRLSSNDRGGEKKGGDEGREDSMGDCEHHAR